MDSKKYQTIFDCGSSKIRAGIFNKDNQNEAFYSESEFFTNQLDLDQKIQKIISSFEKDTNEYIDNINLMIFSDLIITDSVGMQEELAYLGCPFIVLRKNTERPVALNNNNSFLCNKIDNAELSLKINMIISKKRQNKIKFWDGLAADRIFKILRKKINLI